MDYLMSDNALIPLNQPVVIEDIGSSLKGYVVLKVGDFIVKKFDTKEEAKTALKKIANSLGKYKYINV